MTSEKDLALTTLQLLANATGATFEDEELAVEIIESLIINVKNKNNDLPIGVYKHTKNNMFIADLSKNGKSNYLGSYSNPVAANHAWGIAKLGHLHELKQKLDEVDTRLFPRMFSLIVDLIV